MARAGEDVSVYNQAADAAATGGYRLHLDARACAAFRRHLTPELVAAIRASAANRGRFGEVGDLPARPPDARAGRRRAGSRRRAAPDRPRAAADAALPRDRGPSAFRATFSGFDVGPDQRVAVHFADGSTTLADLLVGADGVGSRVAGSLAGRPTSARLGVSGIAGRARTSSWPRVPAVLERWDPAVREIVRQSSQGSCRPHRCNCPCDDSANSATTRGALRGSGYRGPADGRGGGMQFGTDQDAVERVTAQLAGVGRLGVAFSGGVDSSVLLALAVRGARAPTGWSRVLGVSPSLAADERRAAHDVAAAIGVAGRRGRDPRGRAGRLPGQRPGPVLPLQGRAVHPDRRRGRRARTGSTRSRTARTPTTRGGPTGRARGPPPSTGCCGRWPTPGWTRPTVRRIARALGLPCADKPAAPCLASRIPHFTSRSTPEKLAQIEAAEAALRALGFGDCRVRHHGDIARIELPADDLSRAVRRAAARARSTAPCGRPASGSSPSTSPASSPARSPCRWSAVTGG